MNKRIKKKKAKKRNEHLCQGLICKVLSARVQTSILLELSKLNLPGMRGVPRSPLDGPCPRPLAVVLVPGGQSLQSIPIDEWMNKPDLILPSTPFMRRLSLPNDM